MATYLARITVRDDLGGIDDDQVAGMADALGAVGEPWVEARAVVFEVPGEAPDGGVAYSAAAQHAAEVLDGYAYEVHVTETY